MARAGQGVPAHRESAGIRHEVLQGLMKARQTLDTGSRGNSATLVPTTLVCEDSSVMFSRNAATPRRRPIASLASRSALGACAAAAAIVLAVACSEAPAAPSQQLTPGADAMARQELR